MPSVLGGLEGRTVYDNELRAVPFDKLDDSARLAQTNIPRRMVIVTGAFPYKQQLEEYRKAMRYGSVEELLLDPTAARPEFFGFNVQRRSYNAQGQPVDTEWTDIDVQADMKKLIMQAVDREPEDPRLQELGIIVQPNRIVMPLPVLARGQKYPQPKLESIDQTQEAMLKAVQGNVPPPPPKRTRFSDIDIFDPRSGAVGQDAPRAGDSAPKTGKGGGAPDSLSPPSGATQNAVAIPEKCLIRFVDADRNLHPGYSYEYRIQILMSNPCHEKPDRAVSKRDTEKEAVAGPWQEVTWTENGQKVSKVTIPDELLYYVVDEKTERSSAVANKDRAFVQIHRWLTEPRTKPDTANTEVQVGDWTILERREVHRGEYVGRVQEVEVPTWNPAQERFIIAVHPTELKTRGQTQRIRRYSGIPIDFATDPVNNERPLVVDFEGGERSISVAGRQVKHTGPVEMLIWTADNKLVVRNSRDDTDNTERQTRVTAWKEWVDRVRAQADDKTDDKNNLFPTTPGGKGSGGAPSGSGSGSGS
jgi:hypothetical protein